MGSTGLLREKGLTDRAFFEREFPQSLAEHGRIVACASKPTRGDWQRVFYAAVRNNDDAPHMPGQTWALVILMKRSRADSYGCNFWYKEMDETMGPGEDECPIAILDLLSPTDHDYASEWRAQCRAHAAKLAAAPAVRDGSIVVFNQPVTFTNGYAAQRFRYRREGRRTWFEALATEGYVRFKCRVTSWKQMQYTVEVSAA